MIADNSISLSDLATDSVSASKILSGAVGSSEVATNSLTADDLASGSVGSSELASNSVNSVEIVTHENKVTKGGKVKPRFSLLG